MTGRIIVQDDDAEVVVPVKQDHIRSEFVGQLEAE